MGVIVPAEPVVAKGREGDDGNQQQHADRERVQPARGGGRL